MTLDEIIDLCRWRIGVDNSDNADPLAIAVLAMLSKPLPSGFEVPTKHVMLGVDGGPWNVCADAFEGSPSDARAYAAAMLRAADSIDGGAR